MANSSLASRGIVALPFILMLPPPSLAVRSAEYLVPLAVMLPLSVIPSGIRMSLLISGSRSAVMKFRLLALASILMSAFIRRRSVTWSIVPFSVACIAVARSISMPVSFMWSILPSMEPLMISGRVGKCCVNFWGSWPVRAKMSCLPTCANSRSFMTPGCCSLKALKSISASAMMLESGVLSDISGMRI